MRIVGGRFAGRALTSPNDFRVRPTAEKVRIRLLDLFAGTGALGLEAMSRGAKSVDFVETRPSSLHALRANVGLLRLSKRVRIFKRDALPFAAALARDSYDIAFVDPPYESRMLDRAIDTWRERAFSRVLAVEHARGHELPAGAHRESNEETSITIYRI